MLGNLPAGEKSAVGPDPSAYASVSLINRGRNAFLRPHGVGKTQSGQTRTHHDNARAYGIARQRMQQRSARDCSGSTQEFTARDFAKTPLAPLLRYFLKRSPTLL